MSALPQCQPHRFSTDLSFSGTIVEDYFLFLCRPLCLPEMGDWQIKFVLSTDGGS
jgi:hypothetical protein